MPLCKDDGAVALSCIPGGVRVRVTMKAYHPFSSIGCEPFLRTLSHRIPAFPPELLTLPEQLAALQMQVAALHQQVTDLTHLLTRHQADPAPSLPPAQPTTALTSNAKPPRSRPAATKTAIPKTPAKPTHVIPRVEYSEQGHYVVICPKKGLLPFEPETEEWFAWVREQESFRFVGQKGHFTAYHWWRVPGGAWRAHRHIRNHSNVQRLAPNHELTLAVLEQAAEALQAHLM